MIYLYCGLFILLQLHNQSWQQADLKNLLGIQPPPIGARVYEIYEEAILDTHPHH